MEPAGTLLLVAWERLRGQVQAAVGEHVLRSRHGGRSLTLTRRALSRRTWASRGITSNPASSNGGYGSYKPRYAARHGNSCYAGSSIPGGRRARAIAACHVGCGVTAREQVELHPGRSGRDRHRPRLHRPVQARKRGSRAETGRSARVRGAGQLRHAFAILGVVSRSRTRDANPELDEASALCGSSSAEGLVERRLLNQDAKRLGLTVSEDDLSAELARAACTCRCRSRRSR